jgi:PKD repeat protein
MDFKYFFILLIVSFLLLIPIVTADTITIYPVSDGRLGNRTPGALVADMVKSGGGSPLETATPGNISWIRNATSGRVNALTRYGLIFNTTPVGNAYRNVTITNVSVQLRGTAASSSAGTFNISVTGFLPASNSSLAKTDFNTNLSTRLTYDIVYDSWATSAYNIFYFLPQGISIVDKNGFTDIMIRISNDTDSNLNTGTSVATSSVSFRSSAYTGTGQDPKLVVEYTEGISSPISTFTTNITTGYYPTDILFTSTTTGIPTEWNWSFGDGTWSNSSVIGTSTHTYTTNGTFSPFLITSNSIGTNKSTQNTVINIKSIYSQFVTNTTTLLFNEYIQFTNTSLGQQASVIWDFGDGTTSTVNNPTHSYSSCGNYTVNLTATSTDGVSNRSANTVINVYAGLILNQSIDEMGVIYNMVGLSGDGVSNTHYSTSGYTLGNADIVINASTTSVVANITNTTYVYGLANTTGTYEFFIKFPSTPTGISTDTYFFYINNGGSMPMQIGIGASGTLAIRYNNGGSNQNGIGTKLNTSTWQHLAYVISAANGSGKLYQNGEQVISIMSPNTYTSGGKTGFYAFPNKEYEIDEYRVSNTQRYPGGDAFTPTTTEFNVDANTITLIHFNLSSDGSVCPGGEVNILPIVSFSLDKKQFTFTRPVTCTDASVNATSWLWKFGDGTTSTAQNPVHRYNNTGRYLINLTATNAAGSNVSVNQQAVIIGEEIYM